MYRESETRTIRSKQKLRISRVGEQDPWCSMCGPTKMVIRWLLLVLCFAVGVDAARKCTCEYEYETSPPTKPHPTLRPSKHPSMTPTLRPTEGPTAFGANPGDPCDVNTPCLYGTTCVAVVKPDVQVCTTIEFCEFACKRRPIKKCKAKVEQVLGCYCKRIGKKCVANAQPLV